jgi:hypothetical protein
MVSVGQRTAAQPFLRSPNNASYVSLLDRYALNISMGEPNWDHIRRDIAIEHRGRMNGSFKRMVPLGQRLAEKFREEFRAIKDSKRSSTDRLTSVLDRQNWLKRGTDNRWLQRTRIRYDPNLRPQLEPSDNESRRIAMGYRDKSKSLSDFSSEPSVRPKPLQRRHSVTAALDKRDNEIRETFENENQWTRELRRRHPYQVNRERMNEQDIYRINRINAAIKRDLDQNYMRADRRKSVGRRAVLPNIQLRPVQTNIFPVPEEEDSGEY